LEGWEDDPTLVALSLGLMLMRINGYAHGFESFNSTANNSPGSLGGLVDVLAAGKAVTRTI
jgi:hypothetical protein